MFKMINGQSWDERALNYYFEFRWWKYLIVFLIAFVLGRWG